MNHTLINSALSFAARAHAHQKRKGTAVPYIVHPVGVMLVLLEFNVHEPEILAAALLHDTVEDTATTLDDLRREFGKHIAYIVEGCSEPDKEDSWENRKHHTIEFLKTAPFEILLVSAADKLHNLRSMVMDEAYMGEALWTRFKRGRAQTGWYYRELAHSFSISILAQHPLTTEFSALTQTFFGAE